MAYRTGTQERKNMNLPNKLTLTRMIVILLTIVAMVVLSFLNINVSFDIWNTSINLIYLIFCGVFILAAFTDFLDGHIARKRNLVTDFGKFLDPIADKLLNDVMMIFLLVPQAYAPNQRSDKTMLTLLMVCVMIMIARDLIVDGIRLVAVKKGEVIAANIFGKIKTVLQMVAIPFLLLNNFPFSYFDSTWPQYLQISNLLFYLATFASLLSGIIYIVQNRHVLKSTEKKPEEECKCSVCLEAQEEPVIEDKSDDLNDLHPLFDTLKERGLTLGSVESLTGGLFSSSFTSIPGASSIYKGSLITYSAEEKINLAHVDKKIIDEHGVVSEETVVEMARNGKDVLGVDVCVAITGNAGPTSDIDNKPVGEVHIAVAINNRTIFETLSLIGNRDDIRSMCVKKMSELVLFSLNN